MGQLQPLLFNFVLFKEYYTEKRVDFRRNRARIVRVEVEHADAAAASTASTASKKHFLFEDNCRDSKFLFSNSSASGSANLKSFLQLEHCPKRYVLVCGLRVDMQVIKLLCDSCLLYRDLIQAVLNLVRYQCDQKKSPNVNKSCPKMISLEK